MENEITRRRFLLAAVLATAGFSQRCATNPVTGETQLMLVSEETELQIDRQYSPHQFSADYGPVQDTALNQYVSQVGKKVAGTTHRIQMPYSFRCVNAAYVNAYAFPGGSVACTRGILVNLENEAELAALWGHELGHVNARHTAEQLSKGTLISGLAVGLGAVVGTASQGLGGLAAQLGLIGGTMLLASYSRDNERQADALGMEYMVRSGYNPQGAVGLMEMLRNTSKQKPGAFEVMFSTHPMSEERYQTLKDLSQKKYPQAKGFPLNRERYQDETARLRAMKGPILNMQNAEALLAQKKYSEAEMEIKNALAAVPNDYAGLAMLSKCLIIQKRYDEAAHYSERAKAVYPREAQAYHLSGVAHIQKKQFTKAYEDYTAYDRILPGNPKVTFFKGFSLERMEKQKEAALEYRNYLQIVTQGEEAQYAYQRLVEWGYLKPR
jgi:predicted Zn-dependent protease